LYDGDVESGRGGEIGPEISIKRTGVADFEFFILLLDYTTTVCPEVG
jgi:hypothetical protein